MLKQIYSELQSGVKFDKFILWLADLNLGYKCTLFAFELYF
jgi:hypothetical protein